MKNLVVMPQDFWAPCLETITFPKLVLKLGDGIAGADDNGVATAPFGSDDCGFGLV